MPSALYINEIFGEMNEDLGYIYMYIYIRKKGVELIVERATPWTPRVRLLLDIKSFNRSAHPRDMVVYVP
jgi:hypothetical protein